MPTSEDFLNKYTAQSSANEGSLGFAASVPAFLASNVAAFGANTWNSFMTLPGIVGIDLNGMKIGTYDLIKSVNDNWAEYYAQNKDLVETTSFIAGSLIPVGLALKGMKALQAGKFGLYPSIITDAAMHAKRSELAGMLIKGAETTSDFVNLRRAILATNAAQQFGQSIGAEVAILASMNASPLMEDYIKDPGKNFAIGLVGGGTVIGTGLTLGFMGMSHVALSHSIASELGLIKSSAAKAVFSKIPEMPLNINYVDQFQRTVYAAEELEQLAKNTDKNQLTRNMAAQYATYFKGVAGELESKKIFIGDLANLADSDPTAKAVKTLAREVISQPYSYGANTIDLAKFNQNELRDLDKLDQGVALQIRNKVQQAVKEGFISDGGKDLSKLFDAKSGIGQTPNNADIDYFGMIKYGTPNQFLSLAEKLKSGQVRTDSVDYLKSSIQDGKKLGPLTLNVEWDKEAKVWKAISHEGRHRAMAVEATNGDGIVPIHIIPKYTRAKNLTDEMKLAPIVAEDGSTVISLSNALPRSLESQISEVTALARQAARQKMSFEAAERMRSGPEWKVLQEGAGKVFYSPEFKVYAIEKDAKQILHAQDIGVRKAEDLNIGKITDEAFDLLNIRNNSSAFADKRYLDALHTVQKYPLKETATFHVDEHDLPVMQALLARINQFDFNEKLPKIFITSFGNKTPETISQSLLKKSGREVTKEELQAFLISSKEKLIRDLSIQGASQQEISIRTNVPVDTIEHFFATGKSLAESGPTQIYANPKEINQYLSKERQMFQLTTNEHSIKSVALRGPDMAANLDKQAIHESNQHIIDVAMSTSESTFAKGFYDELLGQNELWGMIRQGVDRVNNENMGTVMFSSADFMMRRLGPTGELASTLGQTNVNATNRMSEEILKSAVAKVRAHIETQVGNNEFNKINNILAGLTGWRGVDENGNLIQIANRIKVKDEVTGKMKEVLNYAPVSDVDGRALFMTDGMKAILKDFQEVSREQFHLKNTINRILGFKDLEDIGLHIPNFNPKNKFMSYVIDNEAQLPNERVRLLIGRNAQELADLEFNWKAKYGQMGDRYTLVNKSDQRAYNWWQQRVDPIEMDFADISKLHKGSSAQFNIPLDDQYAQTIIDNWHNRFIHYGKQLQQLYLSDIFDSLDMMSKINRAGFDDQPLNTRIFAANQPKDAARVFKNVLLGNGQLDASETWKATNQSFSNIADWVIQSVSHPTQAFADAVVDGKYGLKAAWYKSQGTNVEEVTYKRLSQQLEQAGLKNPFKGYQDYLTTKNLTDSELTAVGQTFETQENRRRAFEKINELRIQETARRLGVPEPKAEEFISAGASFLTMTALRVFEAGHAAVTAMSWPILTLPNIFRDFGQTELAAGSKVFFPAKVMYDGIRFRLSDQGKAMIAKWTREGFANPVVSEVTEMNQLLSTGGKTAVNRINELTQSKIINTLSKPSQFMEAETRLWSLSTGYMAFKTAFPGESEAMADAFAKSFLTRTIGNYYSGQRPALFQGTLGTSIGLFQTYMLSWAQNMFRSIEEGNGKALASQMLSQAGIFGMSSLPLYQQFSHMIGENFSDKHYDLTTGTYRALPDPLADFVIYGLPASMGIGLYTRGNVQPRIPFAQDNLLDTFAAINVVRQGYGAMSAMITNTMDAQGFGDKSRAILEGLSVQSLSRPMARMAELVPMWDSGKQSFEALGSVTREGNTIGTSSMVWSVPGVLSRVLGARSSKEQIKRDMLYLSSYYGAIDSDNRKETAHQLKIALRQGTLDSEKLGSISERYLRSGTATGLRSAINEAVSTTEGGIDYSLSKKLRDGSPFNQMIDYGW